MTEESLAAMVPDAARELGIRVSVTYRTAPSDVFGMWHLVVSDGVQCCQQFYDPDDDPEWERRLAQDVALACEILLRGRRIN